MKNKMLNRLIGVTDDRDEYQLQEIYKELSFSGALMFYLSMALMFICLLVDTFKNTLSIGTTGLLIVNMIYASKVFFRIHKKELDSLECTSEEEYREKIKKLRKGGFQAGLYWGSLMFILNAYILPYLASGLIELTWSNFIIWLCGGIFFGVTMYFIGKSKVKKCY